LLIVEDGLGYCLEVFPVFQDESEILVEPGTVVEVLENGLHFMEELQKQI